MKKFINKILFRFFKLLIKIKIFRFIFFNISDVVNSNILTDDKTKIKFYINNYLNKFRFDTILTKEPDTIEWIDNFNQNDIFFDIGANIGVFTCYAASKKIKTISFEPSVYNLELLAKNIYINKLNEIVTIVPLALNNNNIISNFNLSNNLQGSALNSFGKEYGYDGKNLKIDTYYKTIGMTLDDCIKVFSLPSPDHLKIDVDGIEHLILSGSLKTLKSIKSILIEISDDFLEQRNSCYKILNDLNFKQMSKSNSKMFRGSKFENCYNQIWIKQ
jgi:FkbM family methyltransferase